MDENNTALVMESRTSKGGEVKILSDAVIIEIIHAFKDIILEYIDRHYPQKT